MKIHWKYTFAIGLVLLSAILYFTHHLIFQNSHHMFEQIIEHIAFLPLKVLIVTLVIHELLEKKEAKHRLEKLNMIIGAFFSEVGTKLLKEMINSDPNIEQTSKYLIVSNFWTGKDFDKIQKKLKSINFKLKFERNILDKKKNFLKEKRSFLLKLLQNENLLEHESFTDLLWAVFHFDEELEKRQDLKNIPDSDFEHLRGDAVRAYKFLIIEWVGYMKHLKESYPYLFSLALRTNPFDKNACIVIT